MIDAPTLHALSERMGDLLPPMPGATRLEMQRRTQNAWHPGLAPLDPVTRTEFEALRLLLRYLREHLDHLGLRLAALERAQPAGARHTVVTAGGLDSVQSVPDRASP